MAGEAGQCVVVDLWEALSKDSGREPEFWMPDDRRRHPVYELSADLRAHWRLPGGSDNKAGKAVLVCGHLPPGAPTSDVLADFYVRQLSEPGVPFLFAGVNSVRTELPKEACGSWRVAPVVSSLTKKSLTCFRGRLCFHPRRIPQCAPALQIRTLRDDLDSLLRRGRLDQRSPSSGGRRDRGGDDVIREV
jgi:hypothetical protein